MVAQTLCNPVASKHISKLFVRHLRNLLGSNPKESVLFTATFSVDSATVVPVSINALDKVIVTENGGGNELGLFGFLAHMLIVFLNTKVSILFDICNTLSKKKMQINFFKNLSPQPKTARQSEPRF